MTIDIRAAEPGDIAFILQSIQEVNQKSGLNQEPYLNETILKEDLFSKDPAAFVAIAFKDNRHAGFALYAPMYFTTLGRSLWITQLFTHADYRKQGIATNLLVYLKNKYPQYNALCWAATDDNQEAKKVFNKITPSKLDDVTFYILRNTHDN